ncbi:ArsI/CadI family heavy metal resistance metalloenzyme [Cytobacillus sp.]|uniref:ArsI/CadI family heavy metal resistance metalloenzyme n=1 Tax=Cytobacillus sp. TaxID=2675269 RepID=UPI0035129D3B
MKVHVGINVMDLNQSIEFYSKVFNTEPVKLKEDYAKFLLEDPGLNFTLNLKDEVSGNQVGHFGFQVENREEVFLHKERLEKLGFFAREEMDVTCCYATQDKFWVTDPDGNEWEFFYTKADVESMKTDSSCCTPQPVKIEINNSSCCS